MGPASDADAHLHDLHVWLNRYMADHREVIVVYPEQTSDGKWKVYRPNERVRPYDTLDAMKADLDP